MSTDFEAALRASLEARASDVEPTPALWAEVARRRRRTLLGWAPIAGLTAAGLAAAVAITVGVPRPPLNAPVALDAPANGIAAVEQPLGPSPIHGFVHEGHVLRYIAPDGSDTTLALDTFAVAVAGAEAAWVVAAPDGYEVRHAARHSDGTMPVTIITTAAHIPALEFSDDGQLFLDGEPATE
jgi:hypothetical protein